MRASVTIRRAASGVALALLVGLVGALGACSGDDEPAPDQGTDAASTGSDTGAGGAPTDASVEDFCALINTDRADFEAGTPAEAVDNAGAFAEQLAELGTPAEIPADARDGFVAYVDFLRGVTEADIRGFLSQQGTERLAEAFGDDQADISAFLGYAGETCVEGGG